MLTRASSTILPSLLTTLPYGIVWVFLSGNVAPEAPLNILSARATLPSPLMRTIPIPPGPAAVDTAGIISSIYEVLT